MGIWAFGMNIYCDAMIAFSPLFAPNALNSHAPKGVVGGGYFFFSPNVYMGCVCLF